MVEEPGEEQRQEIRLARREARRRALRRRRRAALAALVAAGLLVAVIAILASAGSEPGAGEGGRTVAGRGAGGRGTGQSAPAREPSRRDRRLVRNATPQPGWRPHRGPVPILEYHVLGAAPAGAPYPELYVTRPDFRRQMEWLARRGYEAVTLETVEDAWWAGGTLPRRPLVISFDDGYRPQFTYALPELRKYGWPGVLNLKAEGSDLYESNVRAMLAAGWELASHTIDHLDLTTLGAAELRHQIAGSRRILRQRYGAPVRNFCYPAGRYDDAVIAALKRAGYSGATTEIPADANRDRPYELARYEILGSDGVSGLAAKLAGGR